MDCSKHTSLADAHINIHQLFDVVCWARYFGVAQGQIRAAVAAVGNRASSVAAFLQAV
ncbi:DUF3606 domain-containing protein [Aquabacterium soli]|jgi:hypothetical protein|uniref:DUF3606 domain-containing protein n=1 Tax=Aquabacterium soli TaxID=2493092 RepID=A0A3R8S0F6_9BURK|nr:DUF3606 domain-containing protein [Aquabacterium soli]RRS03156.1 DUF3606 domain-containing protein [Aquabacterium soli]